MTNNTFQKSFKNVAGNAYSGVAIGKIIDGKELILITKTEADQVYFRKRFDMEITDPSGLKKVLVFEDVKENICESYAKEAGIK